MHPLKINEIVAAPLGHSQAACIEEHHQLGLSQKKMCVYPS
ncbi:hypothetical protein Q91_0132 [Cycloclasticus sp. P1]|nr:hypothetical protein Q91_0132 [Cycloclasticus sp. P1]